MRAKRKSYWEPTGRRGGAPLHTKHKESIVRMYFKQGMAQEEIKEFIPSPRSGWDECISLKAVNSVIQYYDLRGLGHRGAAQAEAENACYAAGAR